MSHFVRFHFLVIHTPTRGQVSLFLVHRKHTDLSFVIFRYRLYTDTEKVQQIILLIYMNINILLSVSAVYTS